ncbi:pyridoxamine 5'-phosphate oxidase family protein [Trabulsiella odontotermitis]|uniref:pyridoxamine 5'-phosphate oxidase family protein n=1 Tax=Trabulsiella odontotermitis TaxID=379893 RepID=UPI0024B871C2|nr:pyridoxamine 5'-phosphate oxidase family protein [Trabulsiella odontotermitis]WHP33610.1 pyridoxamine 5'-phosphate oxidase family protein [Trabulsiella odontotermitis]
MALGFLDIAMTPDVMDVQHEMGSDALWQHPRPGRTSDRFTASEEAMIASRDSFYMATVSQSGWPYLQHRGGPAGFLRMIDDQTLAMADFSGNRQYITSGNLRGSDRACLFLMDYPRRARLKIYATVEVFAPEAAPELLAQVTLPDYRARIERVYLFHLMAFDWNCPQHITPRYTTQQVAEYSQTLQTRIAELEHENQQLKEKLMSKGEDHV